MAEERYPEMNTLLPVMGALQQRHLQLQAERFGYQHPLEEVTLNRFPFPSHLEYKDTKNYALVLTRFCIGILVPFSLFVARLVEEKASGESARGEFDAGCRARDEDKLGKRSRGGVCYTVESKRKRKD